MLLLVVGGLLLAGCGGEPKSASSAPDRRVVILGFDGVEPSIVEAMLAAGELPNLAGLRDRGVYRRLRTTIPPQSPAAWTSFATCRNPGDHGVYDFLRRDVRTYAPMPGVGVMHHLVLGGDGKVIQPARMQSFRLGDTFWAMADRQGAPCVMLHVPFAFPPDELAHSWMLCGEGVPELRGSQSHFYALSDAFTPEQLGEEVSGGMRIPLVFEGDTATVRIPGAVDPRKNEQGYVEVPMTIRVDRAARQVTVEVQGQTATVAEGGWSDWLEWTFPVTEAFAPRAIGALRVIEAGERVRLYLSSMQFHPEAPYVPFTAPASYAGELAERYGLYETVGWNHDTHAIRRDALDEEGFLEHAEKADAWLETLTLDELERRRAAMTIAVWTSTDRIAHVFWRFRDPLHPLYTEEGAKRYGRVVEDAYRRMDGIVGRILAKVGEDDLLLVLSDHGFHSFRTGFNVNTWLVRNGYLVLKGQSDAATAHTPEELDRLLGVDWSRTRAYALGLGAVYLNLAGREGQGIVSPAEAPALLAEIRDKLLQATDPASGERIFNAVYTREVFEGVMQGMAPDLQLGYAEGYQTAKLSAKGGAPAEVFEANRDKWSGDHASSDAESTAGVLFANRPLAEDPAITDLGVTALTYLGLEVPEGLAGKSLLAE